MPATARRTIQVRQQERDKIPGFFSLEQAQKDAAYNNSEAVVDSAERLTDARDLTREMLRPKRSDDIVSS